MTDRLLSFVQHPVGPRIARWLNLPQPMPLARLHKAWTAAELAGRSVLAIAPGSTAPLPSLLAAIVDQGGLPSGDGPVRTLVIDATGCRDVAALRVMFEQTQLAMGRVAPGGRILALTSAGVMSAAEAACLQAVQGFVRALAKEVGRRGATANALVLQEGAASMASLAGALRFFGTDRSAYVSGQVLAWRELTTGGYLLSGNPANGFFYMITGMHGLHILGGLFGLGRTTARAWEEPRAERVRLGVELCAMYWHFLLLVWLGLLVLLAGWAGDFLEICRGLLS